MSWCKQTLAAWELPNKSDVFIPDEHGLLEEISETVYQPADSEPTDRTVATLPSR